MSEHDCWKRDESAPTCAVCGLPMWPNGCPGNYRCGNGCGVKLTDYVSPIPRTCLCGNKYQTLDSVCPGCRVEENNFEKWMEEQDKRYCNDISYMVGYQKGLENGIASTDGHCYYKPDDFEEEMKKKYRGVK